MNLFTAFGYPFRGVGFFLRRRELWKYAFAAFAVNLILFAVLVALFVAYREPLLAKITPDRFPAWARAAAGCVLSAAAALLGLFLFALLGNLVAGPFLDAMTERQLALLGRPAPPPRSLLRMFLRSLFNQTLKLLLFALVQGLLLLLLLTPLAVVHPLLSALLTVLFLAFEYLDYPLDALGVPVPDRFAWLFRHFSAALGFGACLFLVIWIPLAGYVTLPLAVCGATLLVFDIDSRKNAG